MTGIRNITKKLIAVLVTAVLLCTPALAQPAVDAANARARLELLKKYRHDDEVRQILFISHTRVSSAIAWYYEKKSDTGAWTLVFQTDAYTGINGMDKREEGDGRTPSGEYTVTGAFGRLPDPGTRLPYIPLTPSTYACSEDCEWYNRIIDTNVTGHLCRGESMWIDSPAYDYGLTIDYNASNTYPNGYNLGG